MKTIDDIIKAADKLQEVVSKIRISKTAEALNRLNYSPTLIYNCPNFLLWQKKDLLKELHQLQKNKEDLATKQANLLFYHYKLLIKLRQNDPVAWDEINELYEDD